MTEVRPIRLISQFLINPQLILAGLFVFLLAAYGLVLLARMCRVPVSQTTKSSEPVTNPPILPERKDVYAPPELGRHNAESASWILLTALESVAMDTVQSASITSLTLPSPDVKGRLIGRDGRNLKAFEQATGTNLLINDGDNTVSVSSFDPFRREVAMNALKQLIETSKINPEIINNTVCSLQQAISQKCESYGADAAHRAGLKDLPKPILAQLGRLKFRSSNGQNVLEHSVETAKIATRLATELGLDSRQAATAGLLHDIGKVQKEDTSPHAIAGMEFVSNYIDDKVITNAIGAHHREITPESSIALVVICADIASASRPGARKESADQFSKRLEELEELAREFEGVEKVYALDAGREIHILVAPEAKSDIESAHLAQSVAEKISTQLQLAHSVKVVVIRQSQFVVHSSKV